MFKVIPHPSRLIESLLKSKAISQTHFVHIFVLWGFAVAQPLFDLFAKYSDFFIAHDALPVDIILLAGLLSVGIPLLLSVPVFIAGYISDCAKVVMHQILVVSLMMLLALLILNKTHLQPDALLITLAGILSFAFWYSYVSVSAVRSAMTWLAVTIAIFPIVFLTISPVKNLVFPKQIVGQNIKMGNQDTPIVFIIFDEIPLISLMDENHAIDAQRYPNFSALSQTAHWFRNYTVNAPSTKMSVPTILTGKYPEKSHPMLAEHYPDSMFMILASNYRIVAEGLSKNLLPNNLQASLEDPYSRSIVEQLSMMLLDMGVVYLHLTLPENLATGLPPVTDNWNNFFVPAMPIRSASPSDSIENGEVKRPASKTVIGYNKEHIFVSFMESITNSRYSKPTLYYFHSGLAHNPWFLAPSGRTYGSMSVPGYRREEAYVNSVFGFGGKRWSDESWLVTQGYQRHLFEVSRADTMIGDLIKKLKKLDLFDKSLIVVTSDHGCSFEPGNRTRGNATTAPGDTMAVPFIIKLPHQKEGAISDVNTEAIDVLPTIADILKIELQSSVDGQSMFDSSLPERATKTMVYPTETGEVKRLVVNAQNESKYERLQNKLSIFGSGNTAPNGYFAIGPFGSLVGKEVIDIPLIDDKNGRLTIEFEQRNNFNAVDISSTTFIPIYVSGTVVDGVSANEDVNLAIAVNGRVEAVTQLYNTKSGMIPRFYAMLPEDALKQGSNKIDFYEIVQDNNHEIHISLAAKQHR